MKAGVKTSHKIPNYKKKQKKALQHFRITEAAQFSAVFIPALEETNKPAPLRTLFNDANRFEKMTDIGQPPKKPDGDEPNRAAFGTLDDDRNTGLHVAAAAGKIQDILNEVACGENVDAENSLGWTPLMMACRRGRKEAVAALLEFNADATRKNQFGE